jgi:glycosyltransferase involved in cell wall biosynthesis
MSTPAVSVLLPVYNGGSYFEETLLSLERQTLDSVEWILIDDGSTDDTPARLRRWTARNPRLKSHSRENRGLVPTLNEALSRCTAPYIARMDADDIAAPTRLAEQLTFLSAHPDHVAVGSAVRVIDPKGRVLKPYTPPLTHEGVLADALNGNGGAIIHPTLFVRRAAMEQIGGYSPAFGGYAEDLDLYLRLADIGRLANLPALLLDYRVHHKSYNHTRSTKQKDLVLTATNTARRRRGLPEMTELNVPLTADTRAETHRKWALWAAEGGNHRTALLHAWLGLLRAPAARPSRQTFGFALRRFLSGSGRS